MQDAVDVKTTPEATPSRDSLVRSVLDKRRKGLSISSHLSAHSNRVNQKYGSYDNTTVSYTSPPGTRMLYREFGGAKVDLTRPIEGRVTTYDEGRGQQDEVLQFLQRQGVRATDYLRVKPVTIPESAVPGDAAVWHTRNMAVNVNSEIFVVDDEGNTRRILEHATDHSHLRPDDVRIMPAGNWKMVGGHYYMDTGPMTEADLAFYDRAYGEYQTALSPRHSGLSPRGLMQNLSRRRRS